MSLLLHLLISSFIYLSNPTEKTPRLGHVHTNPGILKPHIFIRIRVDGAFLKTAWRADSKQCGFGDKIHWFHVEGRPIRVKKVCSMQYAAVCSL